METYLAAHPAHYQPSTASERAFQPYEVDHRITLVLGLRDWLWGRTGPEVVMQDLARPQPNIRFVLISHKLQLDS
jgi:hypothetical protein